MAERAALASDGSEWRPAVLLVDDDAEFLAAMSEQLEGLVRSVHLARSPLEARWLLQHVSLDVIVCDLMLGESDGLLLLERVRTERPGMGRVLLTGFSERLAGQETFPAAHAVLHKPTDAISLSEVLRQLPVDTTLAMSKRDPIKTTIHAGHSISRAPGHVYVTVAPEINEHSDLSAILESDDTLVLDLGEVRSINSTGVRTLIHFIEKLGKDRVVLAARCSPVFVGQLNYIPMLAKRLSVQSVIAPLECPHCLELRDVLVEVDVGVEPEIPSMTCEQCGTAMELADLQERYFAFLETP